MPDLIPDVYQQLAGVSNWDAKTQQFPDKRSDPVGVDGTVPTKG